MPFDALVLPPRPRLLAELLDEHGAIGVPLEALETHKQVQLERFAPSFWHQHQTWLPVGLIGSVTCMAVIRRPRQWHGTRIIPAVRTDTDLAERDDPAHRVRRVPSERRRELGGALGRA